MNINPIAHASATLSESSCAPCPGESLGHDTLGEDVSRTIPNAIANPHACVHPPVHPIGYPATYSPLERPALCRSYSAPPELPTCLDVPTLGVTSYSTPHLSTKKRVLIFTVSAGGGHLAAAEAITQALGASCSVFVEKPVEIGVDTYNALLREGQHGWLSAITSLQDRAEETLFPLMAASPMGTAMDRFQPDLVISVLPFANPTAWQEAKKRRIPLLIVPTDLGFAHAIKKLTDIDDTLQVGLPFPKDMLNLTCEAPLGPENWITLGYPLRQAFGTQAGRILGAQTILSKLNIEPGQPVILFMMGQCGASGDLMEADARTLMRGLRGRSDKLHGIFFCGDNTSLCQRLSHMAEQSDNLDVKLHALPYLPACDVAALMARASVLVTKPGGSTINEAMALKVPILLRRSGMDLWWEDGNAEFVLNNRIGTWTDGGEDLIGQISLVLKQRPPALEHCPGRQFGQNLALWVAQMPLAMGHRSAPAAEPRGEWDGMRAEEGKD